MDLVRTLPRMHLVAWALLIAIAIIATSTSAVEGRVNVLPDDAPAAAAIGPGGDLPAFCYAWRTKRATTHYFSGYTGFPHVYVDWQVRYNGCDVVRDFVTCSAATTLVSVDINWCGFYQSSSWDQNLIHVGANWNECSSPIKNIGACYGNYVRQHIRNDGYIKVRWYYDNEPRTSWVWTNPW